MTLDVLGTQYILTMVSEPYMKDADNLGECDRYKKTIRINKDYFGQEDISILAEFKTIRHELIHAFLHEAGLDCYSEDEVLVDALATLIPKIMLCYKLVEQEVDAE